MKNSSGSPHSGHSLWKGLLITASILSCYFHPTSAPNDSVSVVPKPPNGTVGSSVILDIQGFSGEPFSYNWYRKITDSSNRVAAYCISTRVQIPAHIRERVFPNGSLIIPNLTCHDTDLYIVQIVDSKGVIAVTAKIQLIVYEEESAGKGNGFSLSEGTIAGFVTGILVGVTLIGNLIYFLFFRKTGGASEHHLTENNASAPSQSQTCSDTSPNKTEDASYVFLNFSAQNVMAQSQPSTDSTYSEIKGK